MINQQAAAIIIAGVSPGERDVAAHLVRLALRGPQEPEKKPLSWWAWLRSTG
jgi:hypothetical protein